MQEVWRGVTGRSLTCSLGRAGRGHRPAAPAGTARELAALPGCAEPSDGANNRVMASSTGVFVPRP
jgi:hypothetical protein